MDQSTDRGAAERSTHQAETLFAAVSQALARGATVVTANQRAARTLQHRINQQNAARGLPHWEPAAISVWDTWLSTIWRRMVLTGQDTRLLLTSTQEHHLWRSIIAEDSAREWSSLQTPSALATLAQQAWDRLIAYNGLSRLAALNDTQDSRAFQRWAQRFLRRCQAENYLPSASLEAAIHSALEGADAAQQSGIDPAIIATNELYLVGFDSTTPAQNALLTMLARTGLTVTRHAMPAHSTCSLHLAADADSELEAAANWLRQYLLDATGNTTTNPSAVSDQPRIAVILPSGTTDRSDIDRVFRRILAPEQIPLHRAIGNNSELPYEFSLGEPLSQAPMIVTALDLIRWTRTALPIECITRLLLSPSFCPPTEYELRSEFDACVLRQAKTLRPEFSLSSVLSLLKQHSAAATKSAPLRSLHNHLRALAGTAERLQLQRNIHRTHAEWADAIRELLRASNWATQTTLSSVEFQLLARWERALDELATLDFVGVRPDFLEAFATLETILSKTLFAPQSRNAPIQIMGPLEAAGSEFDAIWFLRANETDWPSRPATVPLLGWPLQRQLAMPGTDATLDQAYAFRITERIAASAPIVFFSSASHSHLGPMRPSQLLEKLSSTQFDITVTDTAPAPINRVPIVLELVEDSDSIPLLNFNVKGGASLLKSQAACAFRAFTERRLFSTPLETPVFGMSAAQRGSLVHSTLQHLWQELHDQAALRALSPDQQTAALNRAIDRAIDRAIERSIDRAAATAPTPSPSQTENAWDHAYLVLQRERLHRLLTPWLQIERDRALPFTVRLQEEKIEGVIGPLHLSLRFDRIDETDAGDFLIDYKTGSANPNQWFGERPDEPQLPLYAVLSESPRLAAVAFALIRPGTEMKLHGISAAGVLNTKSNLPFGAESVDQLVSQWHEDLTTLAYNFADGLHDVAPKQRSTCEYCAQNLLCRIPLNYFDQLSSADGEEELEPAE